MKDKEALKYIKIICIFILIMILGLIAAASVVTIKNQIAIEPAMPITTPPTFTWPVDNPEFLRCGGTIVSYEFISEGRHLIAIKDLENPEGSYIMPLFETRDQAIDFMVNYFNWLKIYYGGENEIR